jgi:hypothetical protein
MADGHASLQEAVRAALGAAVDRSAKRESLGLVYEVDGRFHFTEPSGRGSSSRSGATLKIPKGSARAIYHNHPRGRDHELFSATDIDESERLGLPSYIVFGDERTIRSYTPGRTQRRAIAPPPGHSGGAYASEGDPFEFEEPMRDLMPAPAQEPHPTGLPVGTTEADFEDVDENTVTREEQAQYDQFVTRALKLIHSKKTQAPLLEQLNQKDLTVPQAVGRAAAMMASALAEQAKAAKVDLSPDVVFHATADYIVPELFEIGEAAKIFPAVEQEHINQAFLEAQKFYGEALLQGPDAEKLSAQAQDLYAHKVAEEIDSGAADPGIFREGVLGVAKGDPLAAAISSEFQKFGSAHARR